MAYSVTTKRGDRPVTALRDLSPKIGAFLAATHTMPGKRDVLDISQVVVTVLPGRRNPWPAMHAKGDTTGHTQAGTFISLQQRNRNTGAR